MLFCVKFVVLFEFCICFWEGIIFVVDFFLICLFFIWLVIVLLGMFGIFLCLVEFFLRSIFFVLGVFFCVWILVLELGVVVIWWLGDFWLDEWWWSVRFDNWWRWVIVVVVGGCGGLVFVFVWWVKIFIGFFGVLVVVGFWGLMFLL